MPLFTADLTDLDNEIVALMTKFGNAQAGRENISVDNILDAVVGLVKILKDDNVHLKMEVTDFTEIVTKLGALHADTNSAKTGLTILDPHPVVDIVDELLHMVIPSDTSTRKAKNEAKKESPKREETQPVHVERK